MKKIRSRTESFGARDLMCIRMSSMKFGKDFRLKIVLAMYEINTHNALIYEMHSRHTAEV